jgi:hypothetical protein
LRPGIIVQHAHELTRDSATVRCDVAGIIAVVTKDRWPRGVTMGDFMELPLESAAQLAKNPAKHLFDAASRRAVKNFFVNGGRMCHLFGVMIESPQDLMVTDPFQHVMHALIDRLRGEEDISILLAPVLSYLPMTWEEGKPVVGGSAMWSMLLGHCHEMNNRFLIIDPPRELHDDALLWWVKEFRKKNRGLNAFGAIYYPWLMQGDEEFPPSGAVAGVFARVEHQHEPFGVKWPPANEVLIGVTHPSVSLRWNEGGDLTEEHINPILVQPTRGVVIWGARTLSLDPNWIHINSRRIVSLICEQIRRDSEWAVFENQSTELWSIVTRIVRGRLDQLWSAGLLTGEQAGSEYMVQCDAETNPSILRDAGQINVRVRLRPISTAEYILVELRLGEDAGGGL